MEGQFTLMDMKGFYQDLDLRIVKHDMARTIWGPEVVKRIKRGETHEFNIV